MIAVSQKNGDCRKHKPGCTCTLKPGQYTACPEMLFERQRMNIHADLSVSTV